MDEGRRIRAMEEINIPVADEDKTRGRKNEPNKNHVVEERDMS